MAKYFTNRIMGPILSSQLPDVGITVDGEYIWVELSRITETGYAAVYGVRLYAGAGTACLYDLAGLVEDDLEKHGLFYATYSVNVEGPRGDVLDTMTFDVAYCNRATVCTDVLTFMRHNFLTSLPVRRVDPNGYVDLQWIALGHSTEKVTASIKYRIGDDHKLHRAEITIDESRDFEDHTPRAINVSILNLRSPVAVASGVKAREVKIASVSFKAGDRLLTAVVDESLSAADTFYFRNCFNAEDSITLHTKTTVKTKSSRSTASIGGKITQYDISSECSYEVETAPIPLEECFAVEQLITSKDVSRYVSNSCDDTEPTINIPVIIEESTSEIVKNSDEMNTVKFNWRYDYSRPIINLKAPVGIFNESFNPEFN